ncbi:MAG TPA: BPTI/Kunitz domain-containing protein, partial [Polyangiaceae bacterium]|nr:BPTI/Kunitz domain-containing protein [Polyangiaceae bacterium]
MALVASCGGKTEGASDPGGAAGASASGGSAGRDAGGSVGGGGGRSGAAGTTGGVGGSNGRGGNGVGGTLIGMSGQGGSGRVDERCTWPKDSGPCEAAFPAYFHDIATGLCLPFTYGGCEGNPNRFDSIEECQATCRGGFPDLDFCETHTDCSVVPVGCCGGCG